MASDEMAEVTSKPKPHPQDQTIARQPSIYSLTLDEIQNSLCEPGKNFGSMNMDDFLASIFTTDDVSPTTVPSTPNPTPQPLYRQGSLTVPAPLSGKTVDEVWAHIHRSQGPPPPPFIRSVQPVPLAPPRQPTFGEMTLEDFLVKAGVVREAPAQAMVPFQVVPEAPRYDFGYGGQGSGCNGFGVAANVAGEELEEDAAEVVDVKGEEVVRKRKGEAAGEKGVERRQRRMIKNRESAARSRARKQAYTVELEAELNILKEQNDRMKEELIRAEEWRQQMIIEAMTEKSHAYAMNSNRNLRRLRTW